MIKLQNILKEILNSYTLDDLKSKGIIFKIKNFSHKDEIYIQYKNLFYIVKIFKDDENPNSIGISFGLSNKNFYSYDMKTLTNSPNTPIILSSIFTLISEYVNNNGISQIVFNVSDENNNLREKLYDLYMKKHFPHFIKNKNYHNFLNQIIYSKK